MVTPNSAGPCTVTHKTRNTQRTLVAPTKEVTKNRDNQGDRGCPQLKEDHGYPDDRGYPNGSAPQMLLLQLKDKYGYPEIRGCSNYREGPYPEDGDYHYGRSPSPIAV